MGLFDNVNPDSLISGAREISSNLEFNKDNFSDWKNITDKSNEWYDVHKSIIVSTFNKMEDYYTNSDILFDVLVPMGYDIGEYKRLEEILERLEASLASCTSPSASASIVAEINRVRDNMNDLLEEITDYSNERVDTYLENTPTAELYSDYELVIYNSFVTFSGGKYNSSHTKFNSIYNDFVGHSQLGGASNSYVCKITHQIKTILDNMKTLFNDGDEAWEKFRSAYSTLNKGLSDITSNMNFDEYEDQRNVLNKMNFSDEVLEEKDSSNFQKAIDTNMGISSSNDSIDNFNNKEVIDYDKVDLPISNVTVDNDVEN